MIVVLGITIPQNPTGVINPVAPTYEIGKMISGIIAVFILFAAIAAFLYGISGGIAWITSAGDKNQLEIARNRIIYAVVGLLLVASTWAIISLIFPVIGLSFPNISLPSIGQGLP